jgi:Domain of unknown function (DUF1814).
VPEKSVPSVIVAALQALTEWLAKERIPNAIIGGVGVSLVAQSRITKDIDAVIWVDRDQWEALIHSAVSHHFIPRITDPLAFASRARVLLLTHETTGLDIDLSFGALPFEREMIDRAKTVVVGTLSVRVATPEDLMITKVVASRPKDLADLELILDVHRDLDLERVRRWTHEFAAVLEMPEIEENLERVLASYEQRSPIGS